MKLWTVSFVAMVSTSLLAQQDTNTPPAAPAAPTVPAAAPTAPPETPAPATSAPAMTAPAVAPEAAQTNAAPAAPKKKPVHKPKHLAKKGTGLGSELKSVPLVSGPAAVAIRAGSVNVRSRAGLTGEVIARITNGQPVTVIEEVKLKHSKPEEPSAWAKIQIPSDINVWVWAAFVDPTNKTVLPKKLNMRGGPGENYGVLGTLQRGDSVQEVETKGQWMKIQAPANAYAFVAAQYLKQESGTMAGTTPPMLTEPPEATNVVTETPAPAAGENPAVPPVDTNALAAATNTAAPAPEEPPPPRIVEREGIVRGTISIQAPTKFELISPDNHETLDYLYTTSPNLDLSRYKGLHIIVTGEEGLDERWKNTPVITIQKIQVVD